MVEARMPALRKGMEVKFDLEAAGYGHHYLGSSIASARLALPTAEVRSLRRAKRHRDLAEHESFFDYSASGCSGTSLPDAIDLASAAFQNTNDQNPRLRAGAPEFVPAKCQPKADVVHRSPLETVRRLPA